jgi:diguanylate cyclase (GGDEF)-like protein
MATPKPARAGQSISAGGRREQSPQARLRAADRRDAIADARDLAALKRDNAADARILALAHRRPRDRGQTAEQDARAAEDRRGAAQDRELAACQRLHAFVDRELLANALALAAIDPLTGARARAAGLAELARELDRCRRTSGRLVVAYVDVVGLKAINDSQGHGAGDDLLKGVVALIEANLRTYDLIIRVGGDEFLCAMSDMALLDARRRFDRVASALAASPVAAAIRTGFAELTPHESATELIARADSELIDSPHAQH